MARGRVKRSVVAGLSSASLGGLRAGTDTRDFLAQSTDSDNCLRLWGIRDSPRLRPTWSRLRSGDWIVFFERGYLFAAAEVAATHESRDLAARTWPDGGTFGLLIGFSRAVTLDAKASEYRSVLGARFMGFRRVNDEWQSAIRRKYGSAESFVLSELRNWQRPS